MSSRTEILSSFYGQYDEDGRLQGSRHGRLEFRTTMHDLHRYASAGSKVLEVGAGTGRYSIALAREGEPYGLKAGAGSVTHCPLRLNESGNLSP